MFQLCDIKIKLRTFKMNTFPLKKLTKQVEPQVEEELFHEVHGTRRNEMKGKKTLLCG
jgi:hypothetical protein